MRKPPVKICGLKRQEDIDLCLSLDIDWVGFNFCSRSKRLVDPGLASGLWRQAVGRYPEAQTRACAVACDATPEAVAAWLREFPELAAIQLHGRETSTQHAGYRQVLDGRELWQAVRVATRDDLDAVATCQQTVDRVLIDAVAKGSSELGGTGHSFPWEWLQGVSEPFILAGGIREETLQAALATDAEMLDICSGVEEAPGVKSAERLRSLLAHWHKD